MGLITNEIIDTAKDKAKEISKQVIDYTESKAEDFLKSASIDKAFSKERTYSAENIFDDFEASLNVKVEGEVGDIINQINNEVQTLLLVEMEIVENSPIGSYVPDIIQGVDYTDFLEVYNRGKRGAWL